MVPDATGPVHAYMHASPGCWALYCGLEDWKTSLAAGHDAPTLIQHLVDSYAVQHAANPDRRNRQSVAVHLMSLCTSLEQGIPGARLRHMIGTWTGREHPCSCPGPTPTSSPCATSRTPPDKTGPASSPTWPGRRGRRGLPITTRSGHGLPPRRLAPASARACAEPVADSCPPRTSLPRPCPTSVAHMRRARIPL
jgi:Family of unknown function (DUF5946)